MKKFILVALITAIALIAAFVPSPTVYAEENTVTANVLNFNQDTLFHIFNAPGDIFYTYDGLYISTADGSDIYSGGTISSSNITADDFAYVDGLVTLKDGHIYYNKTELEGTYTAISAYQNTLYALNGNTIYKFVYFEGSFSQAETYFSASSRIGKIAATESGCAYTLLNSDGYTNTIYVNGNRLASFYEEEILDLEYTTDTIYVLTSSRIVKYVNGYKTKEYFIYGAKRFTIGDKVYILTRTDNVESIALTLDETSASTIIAAASRQDWFYYEPLNGSTRLGNIYIADRSLDRVAVINGTDISYLTGLMQPVAVTADNSGNVYVAHYGNHVARYSGGKMIDDQAVSDENILDLQVDYDNNLYILTETGNVVTNGGKIIKTNISAFEYQNGWHYSTSGYIDDIPLDATDFCVDILGNIFAVKGNTITAVIGNEQTTYVVENATHINAIAMSKVDSSVVSYGDLILFDDANKCVLTLDGSLVGSANVKDLYSRPDISNTPNDRIESIVGTSKGVAYMFTLPIEGEISHELADGDKLIICKEILSPEPFVYCICDNVKDNTLRGGFVYATSIVEQPYRAPKNTEAKINADNTPIYKYPSVNSPKIATYEKNKLITILPFAVNFDDEYGDKWYTDDYSNKWYRLAFGEKEGYILAAETNVNFFSGADLPKTNATIIETATLYRYDESTGTYVEFEAAGLFIAKDTRVVVDIPYDTSRKYTKIVFYREGYGTIDADCYVRTEYIKFDGVDIIKIIAIAVIAVAIITLIFVIARKRRINRRPARRFDDPLDRQ